MARITLSGLRARGYHGVLEHERTGGQLFVVDVELDVDIAQAVASDDVEHTVNYAQVAELVEDYVTGEPVQLIETLADRMVEAILQRFDRVSSVTLTVHKPQAPIPADFANVAVTLTRHREA